VRGVNSVSVVMAAMVRTPASRRRIGRAASRAGQQLGHRKSFSSAAGLQGRVMAFASGTAAGQTVNSDAPFSVP
jgi:hypothetical protein